MRTAVRRPVRRPRLKFGVWTVAAGALPMMLLSGCATQIPQALNPQLIPPSFSLKPDEQERQWPTSGWWDEFGSSELSALVEEAKAGNLDLAAANARILEAEAQMRVQRSALSPQLDLSAQSQRAKLGNVQPASSFGSGSGNSFAISMGASYQADIFGLNRSNVRAAKESLKASRYARQSVCLSLTASLANTYFAVLTLRRRIEITEQNIAAISEILKTIELRVATGATSHLDLAQENAQMESVQAEAAQLRELELEGRAALAVLIGRPPQTFQVKSSGPDEIRLPAITPGLPSELLERRPDVAQAEAELASAHARLDAARASFFPQISLSGSDGYASSALSTLLRGPNLVWDVSATLLQTLFDGGKLRAQTALARATQQELMSAYQLAVLNSFADVEVAMGQVRNGGEAEAHLKSEVKAAQEAFAIAKLQYRQGTADLIPVLQTQQTLFAAEDQRAQATLARTQAVIHLYQALGGGWHSDPSERTQYFKVADLTH